jgi:hypothetical protein
MFQSKFNRLIVAGLATAAVLPTAAVARVATDQVATPQKQDLRAPDQVGGGVVAAPGTGVVQDLRAPDQVAPGTQSAPVVAGPPTWPVNPQPIKTAPTNATSDNGIDDGVLIALGGGALLLVAGVGVAGRKRLQVVRQRQLA